MPRPVVLAAVFLLSLLCWLIWSFPAAPVLQRVESIPLGEESLRIGEVRGLVREGSLDWYWQAYQGRLDWRLAWKGARPGLDLRLYGHDAQLQGWASGTPGSLLLRDLRLDAPVSLVGDELPDHGAEGRVTGTLGRLSWRPGQVPAVDGSLRYSGGRMAWPEGEADVPPLEGDLYNEGDAGWLVVRDPQGTRLMDGRLSAEEAEFRLYRAWPVLLGVSEGGNPDDVIFQVTERLTAP